MTEAINTAREVLDLASPSGWGEKAAKADLSDTASALVEHHLSRSNDTAQKIASNLMSDKSLLEGIDTKGLTDSALGSLAESGLTRVFSTFASVGFGVASLGMGDVISFGSAAGNIINAHKQLIELFDKLPGEQRTNPGFAYKDVEIFGQKVEIWSDATSYPPVTYTNPDFSNSSDPGAQNNFINDHFFQTELQAHINETTSRATNHHELYETAHAGLSEEAKTDLNVATLDSLAKSQDESANALTNVTPQPAGLAAISGTDRTL